MIRACGHARRREEDEKDEDDEEEGAMSEVEEDNAWKKMVPDANFLIKYS